MQALLRELHRVAASGIDPSVLLAMIASAISVTPLDHDGAMTIDDDVTDGECLTPMAQIYVRALNVRSLTDASLAACSEDCPCHRPPSLPDGWHQDLSSSP